MGSSTVLIEGWFGVVLAVVRGPTVTSTAETGQSLAIPQQKGHRGSRGRESEVLLAREGSGGLFYRPERGELGAGRSAIDGHRCTSLSPSHEWGGDKVVVLEAQWRTSHTAAEGLGTDHCSNGD